MPAWSVPGSQSFFGLPCMRRHRIKHVLKGHGECMPHMGQGTVTFGGGMTMV